jgi:hypothetical protein
MACKSCNSSKGDKGVYEWFKLDRRYEIPRVVEGKYLKLLYKLHFEKGTLDVGRADLERLCNGCELEYLNSLLFREHFKEEEVVTVYNSNKGIRSSFLTDF